MNVQVQAWKTHHPDLALTTPGFVRVNYKLPDGHIANLFEWVWRT